MSKEQIEERNELADLLKDIGYDWDSYICECQENEEKPQLSYEDFHADEILEAGYRKQEWISAEDDPPKNSLARVQVFLRSDDITDGIGFPKIDTDRYVDGKWVRWGKHVTHWMPLPAPPKGGVQE